MQNNAQSLQKKATKYMIEKIIFNSKIPDKKKRHLYLYPYIIMYKKKSLDAKIRGSRTTCTDSCVKQSIHIYCDIVSRTLSSPVRIFNTYSVLLYRARLTSCQISNLRVWNKDGPLDFSFLFFF